MQRHSLLTIALWSAAVCVGCGRTVTWLPDSSGFVYVSAVNGDLYVSRPIGTVPQNTFLCHAGIATILPAISPSGDRIAVASIDTHSPHVPLSLSFFDLSGRLQQQSPVVELPRFHYLGVPIALYWSTVDPRLILVSLTGIGSDTRCAVALFNVESNVWTVVNDAHVLPVSGSPFLTRRSSFLVVQTSPPAFRIALVDEHGTASSLTADPAIFTNGINLALLGDPCVHQSYWEREVAVIRWSSQAIRIDTANRRAETVAVTPLLSQERQDYSGPLHIQWPVSSRREVLRASTPV